MGFTGFAAALLSDAVFTKLIYAQTGWLDG